MSPAVGKPAVLDVPAPKNQAKFFGFSEISPVNLDWINSTSNDIE